MFESAYMFECSPFFSSATKRHVIRVRSSGHIVETNKANVSTCTLIAHCHVVSKLLPSILVNSNHSLTNSSFPYVINIAVYQI